MARGFRLPCRLRGQGRGEPETRAGDAETLTRRRPARPRTPNLPASVFIFGTRHERDIPALRELPQRFLSLFLQLTIPRSWDPCDDNGSHTPLGGNYPGGGHFWLNANAAQRYASPPSRPSGDLVIPDSRRCARRCERCVGIWVEPEIGHVGRRNARHAAEATSANAANPLPAPSPAAGRYVREIPHKGIGAGNARSSPTSTVSMPCASPSPAAIEIIDKPGLRSCLRRSCPGTCAGVRGTKQRAGGPAPRSPCLLSH